MVGARPRLYNGRLVGDSLIQRRRALWGEGERACFWGGFLGFGV